MGLRDYMATHQSISRSSHSILGTHKVRKFKPFSAAC
jgi:hypothetical protein